ncbi:MAG: tetraacyldisaccharide 4'-kinase [Pseudomonadota bacterium]|nr:tetraacyldisaccharide 4'-kinase [Pseudomonadota bacterium]
MKQLLPRAWYRDAPWLRYLEPLSRLYRGLSQQRRRAYQSGRKQATRASVPVIVIGNLTAGGTGKTPLALALCQYLQEKGWKPAVVSRGYGGKSKTYPLHVTVDTLPEASGDEALLLALNCEAPVVVDPDRGRGVRFLEEKFQPGVILCDDGLQHYALARDVEIAVVDGTRGFGNGRFLPAGPLREGPERLLEVDYVVINADEGLVLPEGIRARAAMQLVPDLLVNIRSGETLSCAEWRERYAHLHDRVHAVAGIGNPERFFTTLCQQGFAIITHPFPDHHRFARNDVTFADERPVLMTEKDAVKCLNLVDERHWCLKVQAELPPEFFAALEERLHDAKRALAAFELRPPGYHSHPPLRPQRNED